MNKAVVEMRKECKKWKLADPRGHLYSLWGHGIDPSPGQEGLPHPGPAFYIIHVFIDLSRLLPASYSLANLRHCINSFVDKPPRIFVLSDPQ